MKAAVSTEKGFTLFEVLVVVAIVGILAAVAVLSYQHFTKKAQSVEAEVALAEIYRLQQLHHAQHGTYAGDLRAIGFNPVPPLKFYSVGMRFIGGINGIIYQAYASANGNSEGSVTVRLTQYQDGSAVVDTSVVPPGSAASGLGDPASSQSGGGGGFKDDPLPGGGALSSGGQRTVTHTNQSVGVGSQ